MLGIEHIKTVLKGIISFGEQIAEVLEDKKVQLIELPSFIDELLQIPGVIKALPHLKSELLDLDADERVELNNYIESELDIPNDKVEAAIEHAASVAISFAELITLIGKIKNPEVPPQE